ncbi:MAG: CHAT domain-containing protein [Nitrospinae bacterium]|nr:CHAT domain-containing protein [Nitrospinota bacterium]
MRHLWFLLLVLVISAGCAGKQYSSKLQGAGEKLYFGQQYAESATAYKNAVEAAKKAGDARDEAHLRSLLGWTYAATMDFDNARAELKEAVRLAETKGFDAALFNARLSAVDSKSGDYDEGLKAAEKALASMGARWKEAAKTDDREKILDFAIADHGGLPPDVDLIKIITISETAQSVIHVVKGDFKNAAKVGTAAVRHFDTISGLMGMAPGGEKKEFFIGMAVASAATGTAYRSLGDAQKAETYFKTAGDAFAKTGVTAKGGDLLTAYAEATGYRSVAKVTTGKSKADTRYSQKFNEAEAAYLAGEYKTAEAAYRVAIADARKAGNNDELSRAQSQLGWMLAELGKYPEAMRLMEEGVAAAPRADFASVTLARLSAIEARLGNYEKGLRHAGQALDVVYKNRMKMFEGKERAQVLDAVMKNPGLPPDIILIKGVTSAESGTATNLYFKEDYRAAIKEGEKALGHFRDAMNAVTYAPEREQVSYFEGMGFTSLVVGDAYLHTGNVQKGREHLSASRDHFKRARLNYGDVAAEGLIAYSYIMEGEYETGGRIFKTNLARIEEGGLEELKWHIRSVYARELLKEAYQLDAEIIKTLAGQDQTQTPGCMEMKRGILKKNEGRTQVLSQLVDAESGVRLSAIVDALNRATECGQALEQMTLMARFLKEEAHKNYLGAIENLESLRSILETDLNKRLYQSNKRAIYEDFIALSNELYGAQAGFDAAERAKARGLMDLLATKKMTYRDSPLMKEADALKDSIAEAHAQQREQERTGKQDAKIAGELDKNLSRYRGVMITLKREEPELASFVTASHFTYAEMAKTLPPDVSLVEYYPLETQLLVWVADRQAVSSLQIGVSREDLREGVARLRDAITARDAARTAALSAELGKTLIAPVAVKIAGKRVVIVPTDFLHYLPFGALKTDGKYFAARFPLSYAPSASVLKFAIDKNRPKGERLLVLANPDVGNPSYDLPSALAEGEKLVRLFPSAKLYSAKQASKSAFLAEAAGYDLIHFASHGEFNEASPLFSSLRLAKEGNGNGKLEVHEIFSMDIKPYLVTLSACQTGLGSIGNGDEVVGMNRAFIYAGSPAVLSSLWSVSDVSTALLMERFYANLKTLPKDEALMKAQAEVRAIPEFAEPFFWSPFYLTGDWR